MPEDSHLERGPRHKLNRATEHLHALDAQAENLQGNADHHRLTIELDPDNGEYVVCLPVAFDPWRAGYFTSVLNGFAPVVGDFIHNVRGALDHITWRLACLELEREPTESEAKNIQFPIADTPTKYAGNAVLGFIGDAGQVIETFQPYHAADPASDPLAILHWLSNRDKHRFVTPAFSETRVGDLTMKLVGGTGIIKQLPRDFEVEPFRMYKGHVEMGRVSVQPLSGEPELCLDRQPPVDIAFQGPGGNVYRRDLRTILTRTTEIVERLQLRFF